MPSIVRALSFGACLIPFVSAYTYIVYVGKNEVTGQKGIGFDPSTINPVVGDIVSITFASGTHSVVQSTFDHPCTPNGPYNSGSHTVDASTPLNDTSLPVAQIYISDTTPQWFFDLASGQCQQGAVLAINPTVDETVTAFKANAAKDTTPASSTSSSASVATDTSTSSSSKKSNAAVVKFDVAVGGLAVLLGASLSAFLH